MRVELHDIHKSYGSVEVVKGLNLDVSDGEFLVLLGESGCGKSTALRMIAGLETISRGKIMIGGRDVTQILPKYRDVAMVFQSYALYPHMNVAENIGYPLKLRKIGAKERARAVRETAEKVHLEDYLDRMPKQLSGGQRQRVALARAMVRRPAVFLMDEPLSNLDAKLRGAMRAELKHLQYELGVTTIYVTHDQIEAMTLAHRVAIMDSGVLQQVAPPKEVYNDPANRFVARFIGAPAMNILSGAIAGGAFHSKAGLVPLAGFEAREKVDFGFRPEDANLVPPEEGMLRGEVFSYEMTGNETIVTCRLSGEDAIVRMNKDFEIGLGDKVGISLSAEKTCLFDHDSGIRLRR